MEGVKEILQRWLNQHQLTAVQEAQLKALLARNQIWGELRIEGVALNGESGAQSSESMLRKRLEWLERSLPMLQQCCQQQMGWDAVPLELVWNLWLPLAIHLEERRTALGRPLVQGFLGGQGTGKSTLVLVLSRILQCRGWRVCRLSLDDLYKTYEERLALQQFDPRLRWRGPPGTHDVELGLTVLRALKQKQNSHPVEIPRFDKSMHNGAGDRTTPEIVSSIDIVLFEGWFVGARPVDPAVFATAPPPILTEADRQFARDCNDQLHIYLPLWDLIDGLIVLRPTDYRLSQQWRREAEQRMVTDGRTGMSDAEINEFVEYFWRSLHPDLFITPLCSDPTHVDLVIEIDANHTPAGIYCVSRSSEV